MARITRAAPHLSAEELKSRLKLDPRPLCRQRWLIIYNALVEPREAAEIAKHSGTTVAMVHRVIASYNRLGVVASPKTLPTPLLSCKSIKSAGTGPKTSRCPRISG